MKMKCSSLFILFSFVMTIDGQLVRRYLDADLSLQCDDPLVTLHVFSSQANPTWRINQTEVRKLQRIAKQMSENETMPIKSAKRVMGYQGFSLRCSNENERFVHGLIPIENLLLQSGRSYLSVNIIAHVQQYLGQSTNENTLRSLAPRIDCNRVPIKGPDTVPNYNPLTDNGGCFITKQSSNNCYAYGTDIVTNTYPQPGRSKGKSPSSITCESVRNASIRDGLIYRGTTFPNEQPQIGHYLALFLWPSVDYHWDSNGYWSHKPGPGRVTNRDNAGSLISNPLKSNLTPWRLFCAFYIAQPSKVHIN